MDTIDTICVWIGRIALILGGLWLLISTIAYIFIGVMASQMFKGFRR